jgi:hypothetical protein
MADAEAHVTVVVVLVSETVPAELVELLVSAATGASIVRDDAKRTRSIAIEAIFFDI